MINFLPQLYENELFYSVIARYQRKCGMISVRALIEDLFGRYVLVSSSYFPQYIDSFVKCLPQTSKVTSKEIIEKHTLFPFYTSFLSQEKTDLIYETMGKGSNGSKINIEKLIGFGGSKVRKPSYLKYCPGCFKEDMDTFGESYWRINHQIIGAYYCSKHHMPLKESPVLSTGSGLAFICADEQVCNEKIVADDYSDTIKQLNLQYIHTAESLLNKNLQRKELNYIINYYIDRLREKGLASRNGNLYMKDVQERFLHYYPTQYLEMMQSGIDPDSPTNWLRLFIRSSQKNRSPLRHLLFLQFLGVSAENLFQEKRVIGRKSGSVKHNPNFNIHQRRENWLRLIAENPGANRSQLKDKGKGLHTWICKYDWDWYDNVTPKAQLGKEKVSTIDWEKRDEECLRLATGAVEKLLKKQGKPIRITTESVRKELGIGQWLRNPKLARTNQYLQEVKEDIVEFRIRKIRWAIKEMIQKGETLTPYKIQLYAGFGGRNKEARKLILEIKNRL